MPGGTPGPQTTRRQACLPVTFAPAGRTSYSVAMSARRPVILLTGFGHFPGVPRNASELLVPALAREARRLWPGHQTEAVILPTEWHAAPARVVELLRELRPALTLHFGVSSRADGFAIEARAENRSKPLCDAAGRLPSADQLCIDGPQHLAASIPVAVIVHRLRRRGLPATLSRDAGGYLCNAVLYSALYEARLTVQPTRCGFVHLPAALSPTEGATAVGPRRLAWGQALGGSLEIIAAILGRPPRGIAAPL